MAKGYNSTLRQITTSTGSIITGYSSEEPNRLRGPQHHFAWCDELAGWKVGTMQETWDMMLFGLRLGDHVQCIVTTTPKPYPLVKELFGQVGKDFVLTTGSTFDNSANLSKTAIKKLREKYEGTRLGRQELNAELLLDVPGALWTMANIEKNRIKPDDIPGFQRVIIAVDPSGSSGKEGSHSDEVGIVAVGQGYDGRYYVIRDYTCSLGPAGWGRVAVTAYKELQADYIVGEMNFGGAMVEHVISSIDDTVPFRGVTASRGKAVRAQPVASLYEQDRVSHIGDLTRLEDQLYCFTSAAYLGKGSPDRADAAVWGITELMGDTSVIVAGPEGDSLGSYWQGM
jgi:phage terminase large subunit-like protein